MAPLEQEAGVTAPDLEAHDRRLVDALKAYIPEAMTVTGTPGLNVALARGDRVIWEAGFGYSDIASSAPMTPATVSRCGSLAKIYTATAFLQLAELGLLDLYDPVRHYLPGMTLDNPLGDRDISVYDLLTFQSGLVRDTLEAHVEPPDPDAYVERELRRDARREYGSTASRWSAPVGTQYQYSSFGYAILARAFREASPGGRSLADWVNDEIASALGMVSAMLPPGGDERRVPPDLTRRLCTGYARFGPVYIPNPALYTGAYAGSGLLATPGDHVKLLLALMRGGSLDGRQILDPASVRRMLAPQKSAGEGERAFGNLTVAGIGVELSNVGRPDFHFGRIGSYPWGWWHHSRAYPRQDFAIAVFTNKWDMQGWMNPDSRVAGGLIADFTSAWLAREHESDRAHRSSAWRFSYAIGLLMGDRVGGLLDVPERLDPAALDDMAEGARVLAATTDEDAWDEEGFRAGVADIMRVDPHPRSLRAFLASEHLGIAPEELPLQWLRIGAAGRSPIPMEFYASALESAERSVTWTPRA